MAINGYDWAQNRGKLERAISEVKEKGNVKEEDMDKEVKAVYKRLKGFVIGEDIRIPLSKEVEGLSSEELYILADKKKKEEEDLKKEEKPKSKSKSK